MNFLSDATLAHLRDVAGQPDLSGTRYELIREIGRGGMGVVYLVRDVELQREVAMKVIAIDAASSELAQRLRQEAGILAQLEHPGIVPIHDVGELPDGRLYYVMKYVRGQRFDEHVRDQPLNELLRLFLRICDAVAFAHAHGIIHRDLKPENVMVGSFGEVLVMDWGVAKRAAVAESASPSLTSSPHQTGHGVVVGTPGFMAPEQEQAGDVDARADVFALGIFLRFLIEKARSGDQRVKPLQSIVLRATADDRDQRYESPTGLAGDVIRYLDQLPVLAHQESLVERAGRWMIKYRAAITVIAAYLLMRTVVFLWVRR